jgi:predicted ATPase/class 3 adenylate cyclase
MDSLSVYLPMDRRQAVAAGRALPDRTTGAALLADLSGFTALTEALARDLSPQRGAEEINRYLGLIFNALIAELHRHGGSAISFSGDAMTCWLDADNGQRALTCAFAMQRAMAPFAQVTTPTGETAALKLKTAVVAGPVRRFVIGDPQMQLIDALAGATLDRLASAEHHCRPGEVMADAATLEALSDIAEVGDWRDDEASGEQFGVVTALRADAPEAPWPPLPEGALTAEKLRPWLLPRIYERLAGGQGDFLAELRPTLALFLRFGGIEYDDDDYAGARLDEFVRRAQQIVTRYDGSVMQLTIGDKGSYLYAVFGAPVAHEDYARRAASAALELRALGRQLEFIEFVQLGLAQGRTYTGAYGGDTRRTYGILGDSVNLAARLMQVARPGQVLAARWVQQATADVFQWDPHPPLRVKGKSQPIPVFVLKGARERQPAAAQAGQYALPMVGREAELELIRHKMQVALMGSGQIIAITADAGMGKSRLVAEVVRMAGEAEMAVQRGECESYGRETSYLVWRDIVRALFGVKAGWPLVQQQQTLEAELARINPPFAQRLPLLDAALNITIPDNDLTRTFDAKLRKASLEALLVDCVRFWANEKPLTLVFDDAHWIDPLSHDLLEATARAIANLPVLIVLAYRPPFTPRVAALPHFAAVALTEFTPREAEELIGLKLQQLYGDEAAMLRALLERLVARAEGNPFYIEELLNYLRDRGVDPQNAEALARLDLPASLHSLILSRIDQLSEQQKLTLKFASIVGRLFKATMLWGAYPQLGEPLRVQSDLGELRKLELTLLDSEPELIYLFKHIVTQEVAYESLPYATRATLHNQIGLYIERTFAGELEQYLNVLAFHFDRSDNEPKRRAYLLRAGEAAQADYANGAAIDFFQRVLPLVPDAEQVGVQRKLGQVLELTGRWPEAQAAYMQAFNLATTLNDQPAVARCEISLGELMRKQGKFDEAGMWLDLARSSFEELGDRDGIAQVLHIAGTLANQQGQPGVAREQYEASLRIRRELDDTPRVAALLSNLAIVARSQGDTARARSLHEEGLALRRAIGDRWATAVSLNNLGNVALDQGDFAEARARIEEAAALLREVGDRAALAISLNNLGNVTRSQADFAAAARLYRESLLINRELGDKWALAYLLEDMGQLAAMWNQAERALALCGAASALRESIRAPLSPAEQSKLEAGLAPARAALSPEAQSAAWEAGRALTAEAAVEEGLRA